MVKQVSSGILIHVDSNFEDEFSNSLNWAYYYSYKITIENLNSFPVKLLYRHWEIFDSANNKRIINGEGVVGKQPVIGPGEEFEYSSGCDLNGILGCMKGEYTLLNLETGETFNASIPLFRLELPFSLN